VHIDALVGHGPLKAEVEEVPTSTALLIADQILSTQLGTTLPSRIAPNNGLKHDRERRRVMNKVKDTGWHDLKGAG